MKRCFKCLIEKPFDAFYKHGQMNGGRVNKCIECTKADVRKNRLEKLEHYRSYDRMRASWPERVAARQAYSQTPEGKLAHARANSKWMVSNAIRRKASHAVNNAIRDGKLEKQPCFVCGRKAHAHHPDYSRPLSVTWLCPQHHKEAHKIVAMHMYEAGVKETLHF